MIVNANRRRRRENPLQNSHVLRGIATLNRLDFLIHHRLVVPPENRLEDQTDSHTATVERLRITATPVIQNDQFNNEDFSRFFF